MYTEQEARIRLSNSPLRALTEKPVEKESDLQEVDTPSPEEVAK